MAATHTFEELFKDGQARIDFSPPASNESAGLPLLSPNDNLEVTTEKLSALAAMIEKGKSIAVYTGLRDAADTPDGPVATARKGMKPDEIAQFDVWWGGITMPDFNFTENKVAIRGGNASRKRYEKRARAMNRIWETNVAVAENAMYVSTEMPYAIPLIVAVAKLESAERELGGLTSMERAEAQIAHRAVVTATTNMNHAMAKMHRQVAKLNSAKKVIQAREHALQAKTESRKPKKDEMKKRRESPNTELADWNVNYSTAATRSDRDERVDLLDDISETGDMQPPLQPECRGPSPKRRRIEGPPPREDV